MPRFRDRATGEILVLMIAGTICSSVLLAGATAGIVKITNPNADITSGLNALTDVINTLIGLLAGFLAGRTDRSQELEPPKSDNEPPDSGI
jgi:hypothetical protein